MYQRLIKPLLFRLNIEQAHATVLWVLHLVGQLPYGRKMLKANYSYEDPSLEREVFGVKFKNPIGLAAGFDCNGDIIGEVGALGFGFVEIGTITPEAQEGNPKPRIFRLSKDRAIINRIGHANRGWQYAIENLRRRRGDIVVGCNIGVGANTNPKSAAQDYLKSFRTLYQYSDYFTVNITPDYSTPDSRSHTVANIKSIVEPLFDFRRGQSEYRPIMLKISPDISDEMLDDIVDTLIATPLDGIVAVAGSRLRYDELKTSHVAISKIGTGRLSGAPLAERAIEVVSHIHNCTEGRYPIIGVGGVLSPDDAKRMLEAGASLVQLYTGFIYEGPSIVKRICQSLVVSEKKE